MMDQGLRQRSAPEPSADHRAAVRHRREVARLEMKVAAFEEEKRARHFAKEGPAFWTGPKDRIEATQARWAAVDADIAVAFERWSVPQE